MLYKVYILNELMLSGKTLESIMSQKVSGIKRHIAIDTQGLSHAIQITTANITDRANAITMVSNAKVKLKEVNTILGSVYNSFSRCKLNISAKIVNHFR